MLSPSLSLLCRPWNMNSSSGDDEAPKDPRTGGEDFTQQFTDKDFEGE